MNKIQASTTDIQRNSKVRSSNFASLVLEHSLVLGAWDLDVPKESVFHLCESVAHKSHLANSCPSNACISPIQKRLGVSRCLSMARKVKQAKRPQKKFAIFSGHFDRKTLANTAKTAQKIMQNCSKNTRISTQKNQLKKLRKTKIIVLFPFANDAFNPFKMSQTPAIETPPEVKTFSPSTARDFSRPVVRPKKGTLQLLGEVLNHGGPGYLQFAITNICNADCDFCGFARSKFNPRSRRSVTFDEAKVAIDMAVKNHIGYLLFVGGEPMVHRELRAMTRYAAEHGIRPMICTNGGLWTDENMRQLASDGLTSVIMSIDAHDIAKHEKNRGLPDVCKKIKRANDYFQSVGIQTTASITASRLIEDYEKLPAFLESLNFKSCTFSYPLTALASSYLSFSDSGLVNYSKDELIALFGNIKAMKAHSGFPVVNPNESLDEMQRHLRGEKEKFGCLGGHKYFYLDWNLDLYRCHFWEKPMCKVWEWDDSKLIRDGCTRCMIDCYRDPSVLQFVAISASDAWNNLKKGNLAGAAKNVLDSRNWTSIKAVWEDRKWIKGV